MSRKVVDEWKKQGMPLDADFWSYFNFDDGDSLRFGMFEPIPGVPGQGVIYEDEYKRIARDCWGQVIEFYRHGDSMAQGARRTLEHGLDTREKWEFLKSHFRDDEPLRFPSHWDDSRPPLYLFWPTQGPTPYHVINREPWEQQVKRWKNRDYRLEIEGPSIGMIKEVMGLENFCYMLYDDFEMLGEIVETRAVLAESVINKMSEEIDFDVLHFWEDLAFNNGPLISPQHLEKLAGPMYRRLADLFRSKGGRIVSVDSDGDIWELIPVWIRNGINHIWPMEYKAGMDVVRVRAEFGHSFSMRGGINKYALLEGKDAIDRELDRIAPVVQDGGYIPMLDHHVPEGVTFDNFCYYIEKKKELLGCP